MSEKEALELYDLVDHNHDGVVSEIELIKAVRGNPQLSEKLGLPHEVRQEDGSRDRVQVGSSVMEF